MGTTSVGRTSRPRNAPPSIPHKASDAELSAVREYLARGDLPRRLSAAESDIEHADYTDDDYVECRQYERPAEQHGLSMTLLEAAMSVRREMGPGLDDLIHASALAQAIPMILDWGEDIEGRPRLARTRDSRNPFGLETDERVVIANTTDWSEPNALRLRQLQRELFWDYAWLALDPRNATLVAIGPEPESFLKSDTHGLAWAFDGAPRKLIGLFDYRRLDMRLTVSKFYAMYWTVDILDLRAGAKF